MFQVETGRYSKGQYSPAHKEGFVEYQAVFPMNKDNIDSAYTVYGYRWIVLVVFVLAGVSNAAVLLTWSPISDKASDYWDGLSVTFVNLLAVMFQIL